MKRRLIIKQIVFLFSLCNLPNWCIAQFNISGHIVNHEDKKSLSNANVFLSNATIGCKSAVDGSFTLQNIKPGKYELVVSIVGFQTYHQSITASFSNIVMTDISLLPKIIVLKEVSIKYQKDPNREIYYEWFKTEFLGTSERAQNCKILNPGIIDLSYDEPNNKLTATSGDFLEIENDALGYKLKYLLTNFTFENNEEKKIYYEGPVLFEELKGSPSQKKRWLKKREEIYENSPMHFFRATLNDRLTTEGFRVQEYALYANPERQSDSVINAKIAYYQGLKKQRHFQHDSLSYWDKKSKLSKILYKLMPSPLSKKDILVPNNEIGQFDLNTAKYGLYVAYNKTHHFHPVEQKYLYNNNNTENTLVKFNGPEATLNTSGIIINPYSVIYYGVWGRYRVAEMLPMDYEPEGIGAQIN